VLAGRGLERLESGGGIWTDEIAGETCQWSRVKWRAGCWGESPSKANRKGQTTSAKRVKNFTAGLTNQG
jgi:hypothetical protein